MATAALQDAVQRLSFRVDSSGIAETDGKVKALRKSYDDVGTSAKAVTGAFDDQSRQLDELKARIDAYERGVAAAAAANDNAARGLKSANDNVRESGKGFLATASDALSLAGHLKTAAAAAYVLVPAFRTAANTAVMAVGREIVPAIGAISPAAAAAGGAVVGALGPAFAFMAKIAAPILAVVTVVKLLETAWDAAGEHIKAMADLSERSLKSGLSIEFLQRIQKGAEAVGFTVESTVAAIKKFDEAITPQLGGSTFDKKLQSLIDANNFVGNAGVVAYRNAANAEDKYRAVVALITEAMTRGQRLAALDLAATFASPQMLDALRNSDSALARMQEAADKISRTDLISPESVANAVALKNRIEEAERILGEKWRPFQDLFIQVGMVLKSIWADTLEYIAAKLDLIVKTANASIGLLQHLRDAAALVPGPVGALANMARAAPDPFANLPLPGAAPALPTAADGSNPASPLLKGMAAVEQFTEALHKLAQSAGDAGKEISQNLKIAELRDQFEAAQAALLKLDLSFDEYAKRLKEAQTLFALGIEEITKEKEKAVNGYDQLIQRAKDHNEELKLEADLTGRTGTEVAKLKLQHDAERAAKTAKVEINQKELDQIKEELALQTKRVELAKVQTDIKFDRQTLFLSPEDVAIAQKLRKAFDEDIPKALASSEAAGLRLNASLKEAKDTGTQFAQTFVHGLMQGKGVVESLTASLEALATKMADKAIVDLVSGNFAQAAFDAVVAIGAFVAAAMGKESAELKKAKKDWQNMQAAALDFANTMGGAVQGDLTKRLKDALSQGKQFFDAAVKAKDFASAMMLWTDYLKMVDRETKAFRSTFEATIAAMTSGQGQSGAAMTAIQNVKSVADSVKGFITDTATAGADVGKATEAGKALLLTLIAGAAPLSDVGNKLATINASAAALQGTLVDLGDTASKAAADIASGVTLAIANLHQSFTTDLQHQLNAATGNDFVNSLLDLMTKTAQQRNDAAQFGNVDTSLIDTLFKAQAQNIVDGAGLVGSAFDDLIRQFPSLTGVIHESTAALKQQQDAQNAAARGIVDYVNGLTAGSASTLSPAARLTAAQGAYNSKLALAQGGNTDALSSITGDADNLKNALQAMFGSSSQFQQGLAAIKSQLLALPAVTQTTDPVTAALRDVLLAVQQGNASQLVASQLAGSGLATQTTAAAISASAAQTSSLQTSANIILSSSTQLQTTTNTLLNSIQTLQSTSSAQLALLNDQLSAHPLTASLRFNNTTQTVTVSNNMIDALNKIVINTRATANNTAAIVFLQPGGASFPQYYGTLATGGVIPPGGLALVSEHSPGGGRFVRAGAEPISVFPGAPQGANDNRELIAELRALRQDNAELRRLIAAHIRVDEQGHAETAKTVDASAKKYQSRLMAGQGKVA